VILSALPETLILLPAAASVQQKRNASENTNSFFIDHSLSLLSLTQN
jgi:hypothetical protein